MEEMSKVHLKDQNSSKGNVRCSSSPIFRSGCRKKARYCRKLQHKQGPCLMNMPDEIHTIILQKLSYPQLLNMKKVSKHFKNLIESKSLSLIKQATLHNVFPKTNNLDIMSRLSTRGNLEATIKLAVGHLYNEGLSEGSNYREANSIKAGKFFCDMEQNEQLLSPLTWVIIRPPWSTAAVCCKAYVFDYLVKTIDEGNDHPHLLYCVGKVLQYFQDNERRESAKKWLQRAASYGLPEARYELWCIELRSYDTYDSLSNETLLAACGPGHRLGLVRKLREIASTGYKPAQIQLCKLYAQGNTGNLPIQSSNLFARNIFSQSRPMYTNDMFKIQTSMTVSMRYILIDWLIEVVTMKDFNCDTLHATVNCVDRYLLLREVPRSWLQLLGIACMVICTRYMEKDVLTVREAVWLTDNTYKYEELVRMMEEILSALKGDIKQLTTMDYLTTLFSSKTLDNRTKSFASFISETSLLHSDSGHFSPSMVACASIFLANLSCHSESCWNSKLLQFTGYTEAQLMPAVLRIHQKCLIEEPPTDHRDVKLDAVEERYRRGQFGPIKRNMIVSRQNLLSYFNLSSELEVEKIESRFIPGSVVVSHNMSTMNCGEQESSFVEENSFISECGEECSDMDCSLSEVEESCSIKKSYQPSALDDSTDEELDTDTPPVLSCAYLVRNDVATRKRIREGCSKSLSTSVNSRISKRPLQSSNFVNNNQATNENSRKRTYICNPESLPKPCFDLTDGLQKNSLPCSSKDIQSSKRRSSRLRPVRGGKVTVLPRDNKCQSDSKKPLRL